MPSTHEGPNVSGAPRLLSIGEVAERSGVATTALRCYHELGLVGPAMRHAESAVVHAGAMCCFRAVGWDWWLRRQPASKEARMNNVLRNYV